MKMLTKVIKQQMPPLYSTEHIPAAEKRIIVKYFTPWTNWTWYAVEACAITREGDRVPLRAMDSRDDVYDVLFFGLVEGQETEWGYFSLSDLVSIRGPWGLTVERDMYWTNPTVGEVRPDMCQ